MPARWTKIATTNFSLPMRRSMRTIRRLLMLSLIFAALAAAAHADDKEEIKKLIPAATAMKKADFQELATSERAPSADQIEDKSLTLMLLALRPPAEVTEEHNAEFSYVGEGFPQPSKIAAEVAGGRFSIAPATFIHAKRITDITCEVTGDEATGVISYKVPDLYQGKVHYVAQRKEGAWAITELSMPAHKIFIVRGENGLWQEKK
jgi:hypothetical protein